MNGRLHDLANGLGNSADGHANRIFQILGGKFLNVRRKRCRKKKRLAALGKESKNLIELRREAHVEHAVGLVEHENLDRRERHVAAAQMVHEAARRRDDDPGLLPTGL